MHIRLGPGGSDDGGDLAGIRIDGLGAGLVLLRPECRAAVAGGLFEAIAVAVHGQDRDVVRQAVEQGACEPLDPRTEVQSSKGRFEVMMVEPRS